MRRSETLNGVRMELLSQMAPVDRSATAARLREIEDNLGRPATEGGFIGAERDTLVLTRDGEILGGVVVHRIPAIDFVLDASSDKELLDLAYFAQARAEGYLQGLGAQEYLAVEPLDGPQGWLEHVRRQFDAEVFPQDRFAVFRRRI